MLRDFGDSSVATATFEERPAVVVLTSHLSGRAAEVGAGQALQKVLLTATADGLAASFLSQLVELAGPAGTAAAPGAGRPAPAGGAAHRARLPGARDTAQAPRRGRRARGGVDRRREPAAAVGARSPEIALSGVPARSRPAECDLADAQSVELQPLTDRKHRVQETLQLILGHHDFRDALLHLAQQLLEPQAG